MDLTQVLIAFCLFAVTTVIVVCTVYLISLIKELKNTVAKTGAILADAQKITSSVAKPVSSFSDFLMGFKNGFQLFNSFFDKKKKEEK
jgi:soluble cytochrome b562